MDLLVFVKALLDVLSLVAPTKASTPELDDAVDVDMSTGTMPRPNPLRISHGEE